MRKIVNASLIYLVRQNFPLSNFVPYGINNSVYNEYLSTEFLKEMHSVSFAANTTYKRMLN